MRSVPLFKSRLARITLGISVCLLIGLIFYGSYLKYRQAEREELLQQLTLKGYTVQDRMSNSFYGRRDIGYFKVLHDNLHHWGMAEADLYLLILPSDITPTELQKDCLLINQLDQSVSLTLNQCNQLTNLDSLIGLEKLDSVILIDCAQLSDLSALKNCSDLQAVNIRNCPQVLDFTPLRKLQNLIHLSFERLPALNDLEFVKDLTKLEELGISNCPNLNAMEPFAHLEQLPAFNSLTLTNMESLTSAELLKSLTNLKHLYCFDCENFQNMEGLRQMKELLDVTVVQNNLPVEQLQTVQKEMNGTRFTFKKAALQSSESN